MTPMQVLEIRIEADTPNDAITEVDEALHATSVNWIREEP